MEITRKWLGKYPTRGKKITQHPFSVRIFISLTALAALALIVVTAMFSELTPPNPWILSAFLAINIFINLYFLNISINHQGSFHEQPSLYFSLVNIVLFNNVLILLLTPLILLLSSLIYGIRRPHALIFNFSQQALGLIGAFWVLQSQLVDLWENSFDIFLVSIICALIYIVNNRIMITIIVRLSTKRKISTILRGTLNIQPVLETLIYSAMCMIIVLINRELFFRFFIFFYVVLRSRLESIKTFQKTLEIREKQLDSFGNPLFIIEGLISKIDYDIKIKKKDANQILKDIDMLSEQISRIKSALKKPKKPKGGESN